MPDTVGQHLDAVKRAHAALTTIADHIGQQGGHIMALSDGDWIEGKVEWWWKYVIPAESQFWAAILVERVATSAGQHANPSSQAQSLGFEALAMLQAAHKISDSKERMRLLSEVGERFHAAGEALHEVAAR
jgi:hypothetical protein